MSKKWIDVSHILGWKGILSGIERVEYHLISHYFLHTDAGFIAWDKSSRNFYEVDRQEVRRKIIDRTSEQEVRAEGVIEPSRNTLHKVIRRIKKTRINVKTWQGEGSVLVLAGLWDDKSYISGLVKIASKNPLIHVVYDMIPLVHPNFVVNYLPGVFGEYMLTVLPKCKQIMAISEATKKDIIEVLEEHNLPIPKVASFRLGDDITRSTVSVKPAGAPDKFILSVGTIEARKNHQLLYYVYKRAIEEGVKLPPLVIAGRRGWLTNDFQYVVEHDPDLQQQIIILDRTTDSEMQWLYLNCMLTVFPSFYEGWGLPVAESLGYGKVALASNVSSIPEVGGGVVGYFSPFSPEEALGLIEKYIDQKKLSAREDEIQKIYKQVSWEQATANFASVAGF